jgi:hypothetical protein
MNPNPKASHEQAPPAETPVREEFRNSLASLYLKGVERIADVQRKSIEIALQQNSELFDLWKRFADKLPGNPRLTMLELATTAFERCADTQKCAIDFTVDQARVWTDLAKERATATNKSTDKFVNLAHEAMERSVATQKKAMEQTAAQAKAVIETTRKQSGAAGIPADAIADTLLRGVDTAVEAQKELLDLVTA